MVFSRISFWVWMFCLIGVVGELYFEFCSFFRNGADSAVLGNWVFFFLTKYFFLVFRFMVCLVGEKK